MKIKNVYYSSGFKQSLNKFSLKEKKIIKNKLNIFIKNPFSPQLRTHKLTGKLSNYWSFSINYRLRVLFEFIDSQTVGLVDIGIHSIYR